MSTVSINIALKNRGARLMKPVVTELEAIGFHLDGALWKVGIVTGTIDPQHLDAVMAIDGVSAVAANREIGIADV